MADFVGSLANASTMRGNRSVYSVPLREEKRTRAPSVLDDLEAEPVPLRFVQPAIALGWMDGTPRLKGTDERKAG
jgi:hypothetical protein